MFDSSAERHNLLLLQCSGLGIWVGLCDFLSRKDFFNNLVYFNVLLYTILTSDLGWLPGFCTSRIQLLYVILFYVEVTTATGQLALPHWTERLLLIQDVLHLR
jgi:hypothetical protein